MKLLHFGWKAICCWTCPSPLPRNCEAVLLLEVLGKYTGYNFTTITILIVSGYHGT